MNPAALTQVGLRPTPRGGCAPATPPEKQKNPQRKRFSRFSNRHSSVPGLLFQMTHPVAVSVTWSNDLTSHESHPTGFAFLASTSENLSVKSLQPPRIL
jgi:hypothetical protein